MSAAPGTVYCPACGAELKTPSRTCPACHELLPAPPTVAGYGELPDALPSEIEVPDTKRSQPPVDGPMAAWEAHMEGLVAPEIQTASESIQVSRMAHSYPNVDMPGPGISLVQPPSAAQPAPVAAAAQPPAGPSYGPAPDLVQGFPPGPSYGPAPGPCHGPVPAAGDSTAEQAPMPFVYGAAPSPAAAPQQDMLPFMETLPVDANRRAPRSMPAAGGVLLGSGILLVAASILLLVFHASILIEFGYSNTHQSVQACAWLSFLSIVPALLVLLAGAAWLTPSLPPRPLSAAALLSHALWTAAAVGILASLFPVQGLALGCILTAVAAWLGPSTIALFALAAAARAARPSGPRAIPGR